MADNDQSLYNIRYNQITQGLEGFGGGSPMWTPLTLAADGGITQLTGDVIAGPGSGSQVATVVPTAAVKTLHADSHVNLTGNVQLVSGTNVTLAQVGQAITINSSGGGGSGSITAYTPTLVGVGIAGNVSFFFKSDGVSAEVWGTFQVGTPTAVPFSVSVPVPIFSSHLSTAHAQLGHVNTVDDAGFQSTIIFYDGTDTANVYVSFGASGTVGNPAPNKQNGSGLWSASTYVSVHFSYPIA